MLQCSAIHAEQQLCPPGYMYRPTGQRRILYLLTALELLAASHSRSAVVAFLQVDTLSRSLFIDRRGEELLVNLCKSSQQAHNEAPAGSLRIVFETSDSLTAWSALSLLGVDRVAQVTIDGDAEDTTGSGVTPVIAASDLFEAGCEVVETEGSEAERRKVQFLWQMDQVLGHPAVLRLRQAHAEAASSFAVVLWESIRYICKLPYLPAPSRPGGVLHPIAEALLGANLLEPRWGPTRLVLAGPSLGAATRRALLAWLDAQHAKLSWPQRLEYSVQLLRERPNITRSLERVEECQT